MINVWTRMLPNLVRGKTLIVVFSDLIIRDYRNKTKQKVMDDCTIRVYDAEDLPCGVEYHRAAAEKFRDELGYEGIMHGGMMMYPTGHKKFHMGPKDVS